MTLQRNFIMGTGQERLYYTSISPPNPEDRKKLLIIAVFHLRTGKPLQNPYASSSEFVSLGCCTTAPKTRWPKTTEIYSLAVRGAKSRCPLCHILYDALRDNLFLPLLASGAYQSLASFLIFLSFWLIDASLQPHDLLVCLHIVFHPC